jgi:hypothetical protein
VDLKPLLISRVMHILLWLGLGVLGVVFWVGRRDQAPLGVVLAGIGLCAAAAVYLAVRAYRLGARYGPEEIEVRGFVLSRRIAKARITQITNFPAVRWQSEAGKARWTPIFSFYSLDRVATFVERHNEESIERLLEWFKPSPEPPPEKRRR